MVFLVAFNLKGKYIIDSCTFKSVLWQLLFQSSQMFFDRVVNCASVKLRVREQRRINSQMFIKLHFVSAVSDKHHYTGHLNIHIQRLHKMPIDGTWQEKHVCTRLCRTWLAWTRAFKRGVAMGRRESPVLSLQRSVSVRRWLRFWSCLCTWGKKDGKTEERFRDGHAVITASEQDHGRVVSSSRKWKWWFGQSSRPSPWFPPQ